MNFRLLILTALIFFRVFFIPVWFGICADRIQNKEEAFERVRFHKRRSLFTDREEEGVLSFHSEALFSVLYICQPPFSRFKKAFKSLALQVCNQDLPTILLAIPLLCYTRFLRYRVLLL